MKPTKAQIVAVVTPIITLLAGYFGYTPVQELRSQPSIEINVPEHTEQHAHKDWNPVIKAEVDKAIKAHITEHH